MTWERAVLTAAGWLLAALFAIGVIAWIAVAAAERRERRPGKQRRCLACRYLSSRPCSCEEWCRMPPCTAEPKRDAGRAA